MPIANLPNLLSGIRFLGSFVLIGLAMAGDGRLLLPLIVFLLITDWVDGKLATLLKQTTMFGARLDSLADVTFCLAVLFAIWRLEFDLIVAEWVWIVPAIVTYGASCLVGWIKLGRIPTYHTRGAKTAWLLGSLAIIVVFANGVGWPLRVVGAWVLAVNVEALLITLVLPESKVNVTSLCHALKARQRLHTEQDEPRTRHEQSRR